MRVKGARVKGEGCNQPVVPLSATVVVTGDRRAKHLGDHVHLVLRVRVRVSVRARVRVRFVARLRVRGRVSE